MRKIDREEFDSNEEAGIFGEHGYCPGSSDEILIEGRAGFFIVSISDFEHVDMFVQPKPALLLFIGGLPESEEEKLARELNVSVQCAIDVTYLRTRNRWSEELEKQLIKLHAEDKRPNMNEFGSTAETRAKLHWAIMKQINS